MSFKAEIFLTDLGLLIDKNFPKWNKVLGDIECVMRQPFFRSLEDFIAQAKNSSGFSEKLQKLTQLGNADTLSKREFIRSYLMVIPEFRSLVEFAELEFEAAYRHMVSIIRTVSAWIWRRILTLLKKIKANPNTTFIHADSGGRKEKLWPLLLAFKNN